MRSPLRLSFLRDIDKPAVHCPHNVRDNGSGIHDNSFRRTQPEKGVVNKHEGKYPEKESSWRMAGAGEFRGNLSRLQIPTQTCDSETPYELV
jgi:hypothetical protein